jgi:hypothetical protein
MYRIRGTSPDVYSCRRLQQPYRYGRVLLQLLEASAVSGGGALQDAFSIELRHMLPTPQVRVGRMRPHSRGPASACAARARMRRRCHAESKRPRMSPLGQVCALLAKQGLAGGGGVLEAANQAQLRKILELVQGAPPAWARRGEGVADVAPGAAAARAGWLPVQN